MSEEIYHKMITPIVTIRCTAASLKDLVNVFTTSSSDATIKVNPRKLEIAKESFQCIEAECTRLLELVAEARENLKRKTVE